MISPEIKLSKTAMAPNGKKAQVKVTVKAAYKTAATPTAATDLVYNGSEQTGVKAGTGYTLTGTVKATDAGTYTATAKLKSGYRWKDGTTAAKKITWSIVRACIADP